jgi:glycosyltransferase involved in cell wall biosynthesis
VRVLSVAPYAAYPCERGTSVRMYNLLRHLSGGHEVRQFGLVRLSPWFLRTRRTEIPITPTFRVVAYADPATQLVQAWSERVWKSPSVLAGTALRIARPARLRELLAWSDVVLVEHPWQFAYCQSEARGAPLVLASHNVERSRFASYVEAPAARPSGGRRLRTVERIEAEAVAGAALILAVSPTDRTELIERYGAEPDRVVEVPNGADVELYRPVSPETKAARKRELALPSRPVVVFPAAHYLANRVGLSWVRRLAAASDRYTFLVVGTVARPKRTGNLVTTGRVQDVAPYLQAADYAICPIEHGAGTKIKLFESLAAGLPTVAFAESLHGTQLRDGEHVLVAQKREDELLAALDRLADDPQLAGRLGAAGRAFVVARHDWRRSAERLEEALLMVAGDRLLPNAHPPRLASLPS